LLNQSAARLLKELSQWSVRDSGEDSDDDVTLVAIHA
jgi:hypothetical protein